MITNYLREQTGIALKDTMLTQFKTYCDFLLEENSKYNLTAITEQNDVYIKHFADSVLGSVAVAQNATLCDVGSGAGFPSLPLKIARPDINVTLVDSLEKTHKLYKNVVRQITNRSNLLPRPCRRLCKNAQRAV